MSGSLFRRALRASVPSVSTARPARRRRRAVVPVVTLAGCVLAGAALTVGWPPLGESRRSSQSSAETAGLALGQPVSAPPPVALVAPAASAAPGSAGPGTLAGPSGPSAPSGPSGPSDAPSASTAPTASAPAGTPPAPSTPGVSASPVLRLPGPVPSTGKGRFRYDDDRAGAVLGTAGRLRRYRVAVEKETGEDAGEFGTAVQQALAGPGSWVDGGRLRLQRVPGDGGHDFTVYLATARTAGRMCAAGGVDIRVSGRPYTSCRTPGKVIINLDRWRTSVPHFVSAGVPLSVYRTYVVNHEVGHQLGHHHERCPKPGRPAPVMMQQTLFLKGCVANPWPYLNGRRHSGPPL